MSLNKELWSGIKGFCDSIRGYVCHVVNITYQKTGKENLVSLLGLESEKDLSEWMKKKKWRETTPPSPFLIVANQEELIKSKNITEKLEFETVAPVLAVYR